MSKLDYWAECISIAADECDLKLTPEQLQHLAGAAEGGHEHYGQAFYSPPSSDRINDIERDYKARIQRLEDEHRKYTLNAEKAVKRVGRMRDDTNISIGDYGQITRHD